MNQEGEEVREDGGVGEGSGEKEEDPLEKAAVPLTPPWLAGLI